jgi:hypothetical protein
MASVQPFVMTASRSVVVGSGTSFILAQFHDNPPAGKLFVVEHISGTFTVGETQNKSPYTIFVFCETGKIYLPIHFKRRAGLGGMLYQFGSPVRMYYSKPRTGEVDMTLELSSDKSEQISGIAVGYLETI